MSFFRTATYLSLGVILFSFSIIFISSLDVFPTEAVGGSAITGLDPNLDWVWGTIVSFGSLLTLVICYVLRSAVPLGIYLFGAVYWTSWIHAQAIFSTGGYIPGGFILLFTIGVGFVFVASIIGMLSGSG